MPPAMDPRVDADVAADGVDEVVGTLFPRHVARGRTTWPDGAVRLVATDSGGTALLGAGEPVGSAAATAERLLLLLWRRVSIHDHGFSVDGDTAAVTTALDRPVTP